VQFTTHLLVGAVVGGSTALAGHPPWLAFLGGVASHAVLDMLPHHDYHRARWAVFDLAAGVALGFLALPGLSPAARLWGGLGGVAPDLEVAGNHVLLSLGRRGWRNRFPSHTGVLPHPQCSAALGFLIQFLLVASGFFLLRR
jgi:hypothetical protein